MRLQAGDCEMPCMDFARFLLGKELVRKLPNGAYIRGRIVETEAYMGNVDGGSPSFGAIVSMRNAGFFNVLGTTCVPIINSTYHSFYISGREFGAGLLIRAIEPLQGLDHMQTFRKQNCNSKRNFRKILLTNGPHRLCMSFDIREDNCNLINIFTSDFLWIERPSIETELDIIQCTRVGTSYKGVWGDLLLRFYIRNNPFVSRRDVVAENQTPPL